MGSSVLHIVSTSFDLLALITCLGTLVCCLLLVGVEAKDPSATKVLLSRLWRLLAACIACLTASSIGELAMRTSEMSGRPLAEISPFLLTTLSQTHYGHVWLVRLPTLTALWIGWRIGKNRRQPYAVSAFMLGAGVFVALTRSVTGHAADRGDFSLSELIDWLHLLAVSAWGGGLMALSTTILPNALRLPDHPRKALADIAWRFSTLAGAALGTVVATAAYNAWIQVGSFQALLNTNYGLIIMIKLLLLLALVALGASNRYITVPLLQQCAGYPMRGRSFLYGFLATRYMVTHRPPLNEVAVTQSFLRKVRAEAILVIAVLICTASLLHTVPARHFSHEFHEDAARKSETQHHHHLPEAR